MKLLLAIALLLGLLSFTAAYAEWESLDTGDTGSTATADQSGAASK